MNSKSTPVKPGTGAGYHRGSAYLHCLLAVLAGVLCSECAALAGPASDAATLTVMDYGAKGNGETDDTAAVQNALDAAAREGGGVVYLPAGNYLIKTHLTIPSFVTLQGVWSSPVAWSQMKGTTLLAVEGEGGTEGPPFVLLQPSATLRGVTIYYPNQEPDNVKLYPWCIGGILDNPSIIDVHIVNPYLGVNLSGAYSPTGQGVGRFLIRNLHGFPLRKGIFVDGCLDVGRIENVHFWPFWGSGYPRQHGEAFIFGRTDWQYVLNTFCWGYRIGYKFVNEGSGVCNGNFLGIGADYTEHALYAEECSDLGVLVTNGEFVSFGGDDSVQVITRDGFRGRIQFQNCAFWGPSRNVARLAGPGAVTFQNCNFRHWGYIDPPQPAIDCLEGDLIVTGSQFHQASPKVRLGEKVRKAVISQNVGAGVASIIDQSQGRSLVESNLFDGIPDEGGGALVIDNSMPWQVSETGLFECSPGWGKEDREGSYMGEALYAKKGAGELTARWIPRFPRPGRFEVFVWVPPKPVFLFPQWPDASPATNAPCTVSHRGKTTVVELDCSRDQAQWRSIGTFRFAKGRTDHVQVSNHADGCVAADAVKFVPR